MITIHQDEHPVTSEKEDGKRLSPSIGVLDTIVPQFKLIQEVERNLLLSLHNKEIINYLTEFAIGSTSRFMRFCKSTSISPIIEYLN